jgi:hypothetical protein
LRLSHTALLAWLVSSGCASPQETLGTSKNYGLKDGLLWVRGPWGEVKPSNDIDKVIDQLCPAIMNLPAAMARDYGQEYCGLIYPVEDGTYYSSYPSPLGKPVLSFIDKRKQCWVPQQVIDPRGYFLPAADFHSHPWAGSEMSRRDRRTSSQVYSIRIQFDTECRVMKLIPHKNEDRPGEVYLRKESSWKLVGLIKPEDKEDGIVTPVEE